VIAPTECLTSDPLGGTPTDYDPYLVGCFPDPFYEVSGFPLFGCGWDPESGPCPPGYEAIYGDPRPDRRGGPAIANINSLHDYANAILPRRTLFRRGSARM
jgi:hypothetical protein